MKIFGERVKSALKEAGKTQKELARELNVQPSTMCEWLNDHNEPPMQTIVDIAISLGVSTDYLLGLKEFD
ncbi:MAG: helix-turn-helix transcriptional regulator [Clostridia bacterium]|nr:helix-turn-helix transcriptional regulator [Clostridia bacterium]